MRRLAILAALALTAGCTSDSSNDSTAPKSSTSVATLEATEPDPTSADEREAAPEPDTDVSTADAEVIEGETGYEQLQNFRDEASEFDAALVEFAAIAGPLPGVPNLIADDTVFPSLTHVLATIEENRDQLTPDQSAALDDALDQVFPADALVDEFALFDGAPSASTESEAEGFAPRGFANGAAVAGIEDAPTEAQELIRRIANEVRSTLGGPELNIWVQYFEPGSFGSAAAVNTSLDPIDPLRDDFPNNPDCLMRITEQTPTDFAGIVTHEIVHCWQFTMLDRNVGRMNASAAWAIEGMAAYFGEAVGGPTRFNTEWWGGYLTSRVDVDGQWNMFERGYDAIGFWARLAEYGDVVEAMRSALEAAPTDSRMLAAALSASGADASWIGAGTFERGDWSGNWTGSGPGSPATPRTASSHTVIERNDLVLTSDAGAQSNHVVTVVPIPDADGTVLTLSGAGSGVARLGDVNMIVANDSFVDEWCIGQCVCPDGTTPFALDRSRPDRSDVSASLVGGPQSSTILRLAVAAFDPDTSERCEEEEPEPAPEPPVPAPSGGGSSGLAGTWRVDIDAAAAWLKQVFPVEEFGSEIKVIGTSGTALMTLAADGTGSVTYESVTLLFDDDVVPDISIGGTASFNWSGDGGVMTSTGTKFSFTISSSILGDLLTFTDADAPPPGATSVRYSVISSGAILLIDPMNAAEAGDTFIPTRWTRA